MRSISAARLVVLLALAGCSAPRSSGLDAAEVEVALPDEAAARVEALERAASEAQALDAPQVLSQYGTTCTTALDYDPASAAGLDTIQGSALALSDGELEKLFELGFVISRFATSRTRMSIRTPSSSTRW